MTGSWKGTDKRMDELPQPMSCMLPNLHCVNCMYIGTTFGGDFLSSGCDAGILTQRGPTAIESATPQ